MNKYFIIVGFAIILIIASCAQIGTLTGGLKDSIPPEMKGSNPELFAKNYKKKKIEIKFNEFFELKNQDQEFYSSPPLKEQPEMKIRKKRLILEFKETFADSVTYTLNFGNSIQDFHEANPIPNFQFVFSTYNVVDSFEISGKIVDAFTQKALKTNTIMIYKNFQDSLPMQKVPDYLSKADTLGNFKINYIKPGKYKIFAVNENVSDLIFNSNDENIAFLDSFIIPSIEPSVKIDSLRVGTHLIDKKTGKEIDSLLHDSIVITKYNKYLPNNLRLFSFNENKQPQYLKTTDRPIRGKCLFVFNRSVDTLMPTGLFPKILPSQYIIEKNKTSDSIIYWITDKNIYSIDSLEFSVKWYNPDSIGVIKLEEDTIKLNFTVKKVKVNNKPKKNIKKKKELFYTGLTFSQTDVDINKNIFIETEVPITKLDSSKIKLFEVYDTLVVDTKEQKLLVAQKIDYDKMIFVFNRPILNEFMIRPAEDKGNTIWFTPEYSKSRDTVICTIIDKKMLQTDSLKLIVNFDNDFYLKQVQHLEDTANITLEKQKIISIERNSPDTVKITFNRPPGENIEFLATGFNQTGWYRNLQSKYDNKAVIFISDKQISETKKIELSMITKNEKDSVGNTVIYEDKIDAVYKLPEQKIIGIRRFEKNKMFVAFSQPYTQNVELNSSANTGSNWYQQTFNTKKDTIHFVITDNTISSADTLKFNIKYTGVNLKEEIMQIDSLFKLKVEKIKLGTNSNLIKKEKVSVTIDLPLTFKFEKDSVLLRKYNIIKELKPGKKYNLQVDSLAFTDIFTTYNNKSKTSFSVRKKEFYGKIIVNLTNVNAISNNNFFELKDEEIEEQDSILDSQLSSGQIILQLMNEKNNVLKEFYCNKDIKTTFEQIVPGKYNMRIIYDQNLNKKWDTGNYLKKIQPEKVLYYQKSIEVKSGWDTETDWYIKYEN